MKMQGRIRLAVIAVAALVSAGSTATAAPLLPATLSIAPASLTDAMPVQWRDSMLAAPRYYYEPYPYYIEEYPPRYGGPTGYGRPDWEAYCFSRYRSFDPVTGTYRGRDGRRHYCQ